MWAQSMVVSVQDFKCTIRRVNAFIMMTEVATLRKGDTIACSPEYAVD